MLRRCAIACVAATACLLAGCDQNQLPGTMLGTYKVTAQGQTNTCGLAAPDPWEFDVQLSQDGTTLYWSWMDGTAPLAGALVTGAATTITNTEEANVDGTDGGLGPCTMQRDDDLLVTLGSGSPATSFSGTIQYDISATPGSSCGDQLAASGGQYAMVPCTITYSMTASRQ